MVENLVVPSINFMTYFWIVISSDYFDVGPISPYVLYDHFQKCPFLDNVHFAAADCAIPLEHGVC